VRLLRIVPDDTKFDFMRFRRISFPVSAMLSIAAILLYFFHGLNFGIDFVGGTLMEVQSKAGPADLAKMRSTIGGLQLGDFQLQQFGGPNDVLIRISQQPGGDAAQQQAVDKVRKALGDEVEYRRVESVGPSVSNELLSYGTIGLMLAIGAILIYLWFRFEWQFALGAMIANVHDIVLTVGFMSLTRIDFDLTSIAALLTILGYSLNDTVVIYDRIREMLRRYKRMSMPDLLNASINATLRRRAGRHLHVGVHRLADPDLSRCRPHPAGRAGGYRNRGAADRAGRAGDTSGSVEAFTAAAARAVAPLEHPATGGVRGIRSVKDRRRFSSSPRCNKSVNET
jgi:preprotein translocase subunit SecF